jgi:hypothetical protein
VAAAVRYDFARHPQRPGGSDDDVVAPAHREVRHALRDAGSNLREQRAPRLEVARERPWHEASTAHTPEWARERQRLHHARVAPELLHEPARGEATDAVPHEVNALARDAPHDVANTLGELDDADARRVREGRDGDPRLRFERVSERAKDASRGEEAVNEDDDVARITRRNDGVEIVAEERRLAGESEGFAADRSECVLGPAEIHRAITAA